MANRSTIIANCSSSSGWQGVAFNINARRLYELLESTLTARGNLGRSARDVLAEMEQGYWQITAGIHGGGLGGGGRAADSRDHITLRTARSTYHLRFHSSGQQLIEITG
jgi:hypothetical protein